MHNVKYVNKAHYTLALKRQEGISEWHQFETRYITASDMTASCQQDISKWYDSLLPTGYQVMRAYCQSISASDRQLTANRMSASDDSLFPVDINKWYDSVLPTGYQQVMIAYFQSISASDRTAYCQWISESDTSHPSVHFCVIAAVLPEHSCGP